MRTNLPPLISIIVPTFNSELYINECLDSIIKQDYPNLEIIVIDDGSTDKTINILHDYQKRHHITCLFHKHTGVSSSRNAGIEHAKGEYILFVDADDTLHHQCVSHLYKIATHNAADVVVIRQPRKFIKNKSEKQFSFNQQTCVDVLSGKEAALEMLKYKIVISSWGKLFKKQLLNDNKIRFNTKLAYGEGFDFTIKALSVSQTVCITEQKLYNYRIDSQTSVMSHYSKNMVTNSYDALQSIKQNLSEYNDNYQAAINYAIFHTSYDMLNTIIATKEADKTVSKMIKTNLRHYFRDAIKLDLSTKERLKIFGYRYFPTTTSRLVNHLHKRKFIS